MTLSRGIDRFLKVLKRSSSSVDPHWPPSVSTNKVTPSRLFTLSFDPSSRDTNVNADPSTCKAARGASKSRRSGRQIEAKNLSFLTYSCTLVTPGVNFGMACQGNCEVDIGGTSSGTGMPSPLISATSVSKEDVPLDHGSCN